MGALLAALFLSLIDNVLPLFHQPSEYSQMTIGVLILLALSECRLGLATVAGIFFYVGV